MAQPTANIHRKYEERADRFINDIPVDASATIYEGAALGENASAGTARQLVDNDTFLGFAARKVDNSSGAAGDKDVLVYQKGVALLTLAAVAGDADLGAAVYATEGNTFSLTDSGTDTQIGKVVRIVSASANTAMVYFEATALRSV